MEYALRRAAFLHFTAAHDQNFMRYLTHQIQIMANEQQTHFALAMHLQQQINDLTLHRHIQRRGRLIGNQQRWFTRQRHGNHNALLLSARQFMWVGLQARTRLRYPHFFQQRQCFFPGFGTAEFQMQLQGLE